jgi:L-rhamnonate dehydratase
MHPRHVAQTLQEEKKDKKDQGADCHDVDDEHWINGHPTPIANPMSGHPQYAATRKSWGINGTTLRPSTFSPVN